MFSPEAVIYKNAIENNINVLRKLCGASSIMAVVKANAYGHGVMEITKILSPVLKFFLADNFAFFAFSKKYLTFFL